MTKNEIRKSIIEKRNLLQLTEAQIKSNVCVEKITNYPGYKDAQVIGLFHPFQNEINLLGLLEDETKSYCFPRVEPSGLVFYEVRKDTKLVKSRFGVLEPQDAVHCNVIDFMLVPALAISKDFYRVGYGKGYYDYYLKEQRPKRVIGVIYDFQEIESFKVDPHDQKLDDYIKV